MLEIPIKNLRPERLQNMCLDIRINLGTRTLRKYYSVEKLKTTIVAIHSK